MFKMNQFHSPIWNVNWTISRNDIRVVRMMWFIGTGKKPITWNAPCVFHRQAERRLTRRKALLQVFFFLSRIGELTKIYKSMQHKLSMLSPPQHKNLGPLITDSPMTWMCHSHNFSPNSPPSSISLSHSFWSCAAILFHLLLPRYFSYYQLTFCISTMCIVICLLFGIRVRYNRLFIFILV